MLCVLNAHNNDSNRCGKCGGCLCCVSEDPVLNEELVANSFEEEDNSSHKITELNKTDNIKIIFVIVFLCSSFYCRFLFQLL
ncbi:hypothetical protein ACFLY7_01220 [Patescibacteria group bacterium]